jgi:hypothetical protein
MTPEKRYHKGLCRKLCDILLHSCDVKPSKDHKVRTSREG